MGRVMKTILFSGVHGVGKGFFLEKVRDYVKNYNIYSASALIERYQSVTDAGYKKVSNVEDNQDTLIRAIMEEKAYKPKDFILDGHLCVFNAKGDIVRIPEYFFVNTKINGIILLQDEPRVIAERIVQRDSNRIEISTIENMQDEESKYASELQRKYQIEYVKISHECTGEVFERILRKIGGSMDE